MELKINHLSPYLPYSLDIKVDIYGQKKEYGVLYGLNQDEIELFGIRITISEQFEYKSCKPLLRSLKNLSNEDVVHLKLFVEADRQFLIDNPLLCDYYTLEYLFSKHYDVFRLIDNELAEEI